MPGPPPKPPDRRQGHRARPGDRKKISLVQRTEPPPPPPPRLLKASRELWARLWTLPAAGIWDGGDQIIAGRLVRMYDEQARADKVMRKDGRLVEGSQGQEVLNPLVRYMEKLEKQIVQLEDRLGISAKARLHMGLALGAMKKNLEQTNNELEVDWSEEDDDDSDATEIREA